MDRDAPHGPERREVPEEVWRRLRRLEDTVDNGRFLRKEIFEIVMHDLRDDYSRLSTEIGELRGQQKEERNQREADRRGLRNLILAALFSALGSLLVTLIVAATIR